VRDVVALRDCTAEHDSRAARQPVERGLQGLAADIVEEDVDTVRGGVQNPV